MEEICVLKEKYDKGEIKQEELTKEQRIQIGKLYDNEIVEIDKEIKSLDLEIEEYKNKLINIIEKLKNNKKMS